MSVRLMSQVWDSDLQREEKFVALCLADFGNDDGESIYPGIGYIVWKTGYSESSVKTILRSLRQQGVISVDFEKSKYGTNEYRLYPARLPTRPPYAPAKSGRPSREKPGAEITPGNFPPNGGQNLTKWGAEIGPNPSVLTISRIHESGENLEHLSQSEPASEIAPTSPEPTPVKVSIPTPLFDETTPAGRARVRIAKAMNLGGRAAENIETDLMSCFHISPNLRTKAGVEWVGWLRQRPAGQSLKAFADWWYAADWRGKTGQAPSLGQIRELWPQAFRSAANRPADADAIRQIVESFTALRDRPPTPAELVEICQKKGLQYEPSMAG